jgi:FixJ family two-component response regulator
MMTSKRDAERQLCVAIVDDDSSVRKALTRVLRAANIHVVAFESGRAFLDSMRLMQPDCVVLDLHMPGMNGLEVLRELMHLGMTLPVVMITAHDEQHTLAQCISAGAVRCLSKPLDHQALLEAIQCGLGSTPPLRK